MKTRYLILESYNRRDLFSLVEKYLSEGWQLAGGVSVTSDLDACGNFNRWFYQAVFLEERTVEAAQ